MGAENSGFSFGERSPFSCAAEEWALNVEAFLSAKSVLFSYAKKAAKNLGIPPD
ncbi:MAG: hypothetical protein KH196_11800 [Oscillospiraceae bacterium]|nr:hypothetical protein [Oscillospiraceae bacterium]